MNIVQNTNANATNNTRFQPFCVGSADPTNLMITGDQWTHIAIVINGQVQNTYINGTLIQTTTFAGIIASQPTFHFDLCSNSNGSNQRGTMYHDEFRIYDGLLNSTDVTNIYNWSVFNDSLTGWLLTIKATYYFPFISDYSNYASGSAVSVGITAYNSPTFITNTNTKTSTVPSCLYCDNNSSQYASTTTISMSGNTYMSIAFWVKSNKTVSGAQYWGKMFTMSSTVSGGGDEISFGILPSGGDNLIHCQKGGIQFFQSTSIINNNTWNFVVLVFSGAGVALYVNGTTTSQASGTMNVSLVGYTYDRFAFGGVPNDFANVCINNFAIYNGYALTATDITTLYNLGY